jgi:hypothetical protein
MQLDRTLFIVTASIGLFAGASSCSSSDDGGGGTSAGSGATSGAGGGGGTGGSAVSSGGAVGQGGSIVATGGGAPMTGGSIGAGGGPDTGSGGAGPTAGGMPGSGGTPADGSGGAVPGTGGTVGTGTSCLKPGGDFSKAGPYKVTKKSVDLKDSGTLAANAATPTTATIFYPDPLETNCKHPVVSWGNGTGVEGSDIYAFFNNNAASWGIVVIASDNSSTLGANYIAAGIDYLMKQNGDSASPFFGKLSGRAGTSGHSQGAFAATLATSHAAVGAEVQVEGGGNPKAGIAFLALSGTADTVVGTDAPTASYTAATGPSMLAIYEGADHTTTPTLAGAFKNDPGTVQFTRFYTAWFRCFLADDPVACGMFKGGASCGVCKDPSWPTLKTKGM